MKFKKIVRLFQKGNVCVCGLRGTGKDLLFGNVIARRKESYVSNLDYGGTRFALDMELMSMSGNTYKDLIAGNVKPYVFKYPYSDIYISDVGVYYPSQYCNELNRDYKGVPMYQALSRQVSHNNVHINVQNLNRCWDKIREQSDIYIMCIKCYYILGFVIQKVRLYDKYESCLNRVKPCCISLPLFASKEMKQTHQMYLDNFYNQHGTIKNKLLIYRNKSSHDTYYFEKLFEKGGVSK